MGIHLGKLLSCIWWRNKPHKILMVGLDSAGKTTILYWLKLRQEVVPIPTIGYNAETIEFGNVSLTVWDLGGWTNNPFWIYYLPHTVVYLMWSFGVLDKQSIWIYYLPNSAISNPLTLNPEGFRNYDILMMRSSGLLHLCQGLIFVVDLNDKQRVREARDKLHRVLSDDPTHASLLVLANKQEIPGAMSIADVTAALDLHEVQNGKYFVQGCSARRGEGLLEGLEWLVSAIGKE